MKFEIFATKRFLKEFENWMKTYRKELKRK